MGSGAVAETQPNETEMGGLLKPQALLPVAHLFLRGQTVLPTMV